MRHSKLTVVLVFGLAGCFNPESPEGSATQTDGSSTGVSTSGGTTSAGPSAESSESGSGACETCVAMAPEGWQGPLVLGLGETAPSCAAPFTAVVFQAAEDISAQDASCGCECGDPEVDCDSLQVQYGNACAGPFDIESFEDAELCHNTTPEGPSIGALFAPISGTEVCPPSLVRSIPPASLTEIVLCGGALSQDTCGAQELCAGAIPDGFGETLCIAQEGEHECPEGYPAARTAFGDVADSRNCTDCSCSAAGSFECSAALELFSDADCGGTQIDGVSGVEGCFDTPASLRFSEPSVSGDCTPSSVESTGTVVGEEPLTICCQ
ncbi:MAG: hypothetical protein KUG77_20770 [Nannocystaceae bacterium]|nr:hypothetical protein [Nannocystaceae bacterium]